MATPRRKAVLSLLLLVCLLLADSEARPQENSGLQTEEHNENQATPVDRYVIIPVISSKESRHQEHEDDKEQHRTRTEPRQGKDDSHTLPRMSEIDVLFTPGRSGTKSPHLPIRDSIKSVAHQLLSSRHEPTADLMVETDIRTPPKLQSQLHNKQQSIDKFDSHVNDDERTHEGVAVPVIIEDEEDFEKTMEKLDHVNPVTSRPVSHISKRTTTLRTEFSEGLSTWVLLSGSNVTTPSTTNKKNYKTPPSTQVKITTPSPSSPKVTVTSTKKPLRTTTLSTMGGKLTTKNDAVKNNSVYDKIIPSDIVNTTHPKTPQITQNTDKHNKEQTTQRYTTNKKKTNLESGTAKPIAVSMTRRPNPVIARPVKNHTSDEMIPTRRKPTTTTTKITTSTESIPEATSSDKYTEIALITSSAEEVSTETVTTDETSSKDSLSETTTKGTRRPGNGGKKRKKNKNRRRRPSNKTEGVAESKVTSVELNSTKLPAASKERPLSTRIYNYIAREVMPSVGFGLLGLVFTAGLAGLMMYPFASGAAKRTYEEYNISPGSGYYYGGSYNNADGGQSEEEVFGKVLAGMNKEGMSSFDALTDDSKFKPSNPATAYPTATKATDTRYAVGRIESSHEVVYPSNSVQYSGFQASNYPAQYSYADRVKYNNQADASSDILYDGNVRYRQVTVGSSYRGQEPEHSHEVSMKIDPPIIEEVDHTSKVNKVYENKVSSSQNSDTSNNDAHLSQRGPIAPPTVEHGPRSLRNKRELAILKESDQENDIDNDIFSTYNSKYDTDKKNETFSKPNPKQNSGKLSNAGNVITSVPDLPTTNKKDTDEIEIFATNTFDSKNLLQESESTTTEGSETTTPSEIITESTPSESTTSDAEQSTLSVSTQSTITSESDRMPSSTTSTTTDAVSHDSPAQEENFSVLSFIRNLLQFKVRLGLNILKNSSQAVTKYIETVQKRMDKGSRKDQNHKDSSSNIQEIRNRTARG